MASDKTTALIAAFLTSSGPGLSTRARS